MQSCVVYLKQTAASWKKGDVSSVFTSASWWFSCAQKMEEVE
jgi:hypothetical protein